MNIRKMVRTAPVAKAAVLGGVVAKNDRFEVWAHRSRMGDRGARRYHVTFSVVEVLSVEPRTWQHFPIPDTYRSDLAKVMAYLEAKEST